jgi:hypothetical protein
LVQSASWRQAFTHSPETKAPHTSPPLMSVLA